ncbi:MAG: SGNH/GDSL hydrolase family protein [Opitutaceae bacterium]
MKIAPGARLLFIGDSVTDCGRLRPVGAGSRAALGDGYVAAVDASLAPLHPARPVRVANMGVSGDTVRDIASRWDGDVLALRPEWLAMMVGINDVWRQFDGADSAAAVMPGEFRRTYEGLILRAPPRLAGLVLMTPFYVQHLLSDPMRRRTDEYGAIVRELASRHGALLVDTQAAVDRALAREDFRSIAADRVHPTQAGHGIIARAFLRAIGVTPGPRR